MQTVVEKGKGAFENKAEQINEKACDYANNNPEQSQGQFGLVTG